jgi:hypothetical protein
MRLLWQRPTAEGSDHELIWLSVSLAAFGAGALWLYFGFANLRCALLSATGFPCLTCGATRCAIALAHGHVAQAWHWNPLALLALCGVAIFDVYAGVVLVGQLPRLRVVDWTRAEKNVVRLAVVALIAVNWIYLMAHRAQF